MSNGQNILVATLNWGLGHATRCIPIITELLERHHTVFLAGDGASLSLLKKEFPKLKSFDLPNYDISYTTNAKRFNWHLIKQVPKLINATIKEKKLVKQIINDHEITLAISDNRLGFTDLAIPTVYMTHQLNIKAGFLSPIVSIIHQQVAKNHDLIWIPDHSKSNLSGVLSQCKDVNNQIKYIGSLSRLKSIVTDHKYDLLVLLSGPEPLRSELEGLLLNQISSFPGKVCFVRGIIESEQTTSVINNVTTYNFQTTVQLQNTISSSSLVIARSGYSTIMDLHRMGSKVFFIPTPGQREQEYLAEHISQKGIAPYCAQSDFTIKKLSLVNDYSGFSSSEDSADSLSTALDEAFIKVKENSEPIPSSLST